MTKIPVRSVKQLLAGGVRFAALAAVLCGGALCAAQAKPAANPASDVLVLSNGDTLHGKFISEIGGKVTFHSDPLGDVTVPWENIKELHSSQRLAVFDSRAKPQKRRGKVPIPSGTIDANTEALTIQPESGPALPPIPLEERTVHHGMVLRSTGRSITSPDSYRLERRRNRWRNAGDCIHKPVHRFPEPSAWCAPCLPFPGWRRTTAPHSTSAAPMERSPSRPIRCPPILPRRRPRRKSPVAAVVTKSAISHFDAERDEYFSPRVFRVSPGCLRPQLRPGPFAAANLRRRYRLGRA